MAKGRSNQDDVQDVMDVGIAQWKRERPDLDPTGKEVTGRILRLNDVIVKAMNHALAPYRLSYMGYAVLATLRASGEPFEMTPKALLAMTVITSGGLSKIVDRLASSGFVERNGGLKDRRSVLIRLTPSGRDTADATMAIQAKVERAFLSNLPKQEELALVRSLRLLTLTNEGHFLMFEPSDSKNL